MDAWPALQALLALIACLAVALNVAAFSAGCHGIRTTRWMWMLAGRHLLAFRQPSREQARWAASSWRDCWRDVAASAHDASCSCGEASLQQEAIASRIASCSCGEATTAPAGRAPAAAQAIPVTRRSRGGNPKRLDRR